MRHRKKLDLGGSPNAGCDRSGARASARGVANSPRPGRRASERPCGSVSIGAASTAESPPNVGPSWRFLVLACALVTASTAITGCRFYGTPRPSTPEAELKKIESEPWGNPGEVLVRVNGRPITRGEFYIRVLRRFGTMKILSGVVKEELFLQEAERLGIKVERDDVAERVEAILDGMAEEAGGADGLRAQYAREGLTPEAVRRDLEREVSTQLLVGEVTRAARRLDDAALREYYKNTYKHRRFVTRQIAYSFGTSEEISAPVRAREKLEARNKALRARDRVLGGASFAELARAESEDPMTAPRGGWLGAIHRETPMRFPEFKEAIFALEEGGVSEPVENPSGGYHIFLVERVLESESFVDCREKMRKELAEMPPDQKEIESVLRDLQQRAQVDFGATPLGEPAPGDREPPASAAPDSPEGGANPGDASASSSPTVPEAPTTDANGTGGSGGEEE